MKDSAKKIYVVINKDGETIIGHGISPDRPTKDSLSKMFSSKKEEPKEDRKEEANDIIKHEGKSFIFVEKSFSHAISMYRDAVLSTIKISPVVSALFIAQQLGKYAEKRGEKIEDLCDERIDVYELPSHSTNGVLKKHEQAMAAISGAKHLPQIAVIGLISAYDAFLSELLRVIFTEKQELIFTSDREVKFSDLVKFTSIEAVKESIVSEEIEGVLRKSHHEQFSWMEKKFSIKLRENLSVWPEFVELCERRNLMTHTGGIVSEQYIKNCKDNGCKINVSVGDRLNVDVNYLVRSIEIVAEIGYKLVHTMWRKFNEEDRARADSTLNESGMSLIQIGKYHTAEQILKFAVEQKKHSSDLIRRMMVVNYANAMKLSGKEEDAKKILKKEDWTATSPQFQMCVAAVQDDYNKVCELMALGSSVTGINPSNFRDWPVFRSCRKVDQVSEVFQKVYGEPLFKPEKIEVVTSRDAALDSREVEEDGSSKNLLH